MKNPTLAFFFLALTAALLGFSGLLGTAANGEAKTAASTFVWSR